mmetsp:Transcript_10377/g.13556  ORF Transcript_10377/g.13556 Transcript_10377/m.13556 type:complete len:89 (+) Transcript_10377:4088-4354(+)
MTKIRTNRRLNGGSSSFSSASSFASSHNASNISKLSTNIDNWFYHFQKVPLYTYRNHLRSCLMVVRNQDIKIFSIKLIYRRLPLPWNG